MNTKIAALAILILISLSSHAEQHIAKSDCCNSIYLPSTSKHEADKCLERKQSNFEMKECSFNGNKNSEIKLDEIYRTILTQCKNGNSSESMEITKRFQESQKSWGTYSKMQCVLESTIMMGGTGETLVYSTCIGELTKSRINDLKNMNDITSRCAK